MPPSTTSSPNDSASTHATDASCAPWTEAIPRIVAEGLVPVHDPIAVALAWPPAAATGSVAAAIAHAAAPAVDEEGDAPWLRGDQGLTAGRLVAALKRHGGALLADPVGSGKTFVALAVARALGAGTRVAVVVPAPLVLQWQRRADACGVPVEILSHTAISRGRDPDPRARLVVIDESHHFRHPATIRYTRLARFVLGRRVLCVTATPVVNRLEDLAYQLLLGAPDDALRAGGTLSLRRALRDGDPLPALGELVIATPTPAAMPRRKERQSRWNEEVDPEAPAWVSALDKLMLSPRGEIAALVRCVLLAAAASSPAALRAALRRYALLLRHAADARRAGVPIDRGMIRQFTADAPEQLLLWEMLPVAAGRSTLPLGDLERAEHLRDSIDLSAPDTKATTLARIIADGTPTLVFANATATVPYLRDRLQEVAPAWIIGARAGWRHVHLPRERVLDWFRPGAPEVSPAVLVSSDVAAEGLDLQRAARVIHYDLPWTPMRLAQREGRSRRLGGQHDEVEVIRFLPPLWLERRLRIGATLQRKSLLGKRAGLEGLGSPWRWRHDLAARWADVAGSEGVAVVPGERDELLIGLQVISADGHLQLPALALIDPEGAWTESPSEVEAFLARLPMDAPLTSAPFDADRWRSAVAPFARLLLRRATERAWAGGPQSPASRAVIARAQALAREAGRARDAEAMAKAEILLRFAARGHRAGEESLIEELAAGAEWTPPTTDHGPRDPGAVTGSCSIRVLGAIAAIVSP